MQKPLTTEITPPMQLLFALCSMGRIDPEPLASALSASDWETFWALAQRHRVEPIITASLQQHPSIALPDNLQTAIQQNTRHNALNTLQRSATLIQLTQLFNAHKIPFVTFKGIALAQQMGLTAEQRHAGDIDLLLADEKDLWRADDLIMQAGYQRYEQLPPDILNSAKRKRYYIRHLKDIMYIQPKISIRVELHHRLFQNPKTCEFPPEQVYRHRSYCQIGQTAVPCMSQTDHQLYLLLHGAISHWFRLKWLADLPRISQQGEAYLNPEFFHRAQSLGVERMVVQGLSLAQQLLGMRIAESIMAYHDTQPIVQRITQQAKIALLKKKPLGDNPISFADQFTWYFNYSIKLSLVLRKELAYKKQKLKIHATSVNDWQYAPLPDALFFLYYPLRPFIWLFRRFK